LTLRIGIPAADIGERHMISSLEFRRKMSHIIGAWVSANFSEEIAMWVPDRYLPLL
jgi:hypothetical protein